MTLRFTTDPEGRPRSLGAEKSTLWIGNCLLVSATYATCATISGYVGYSSETGPDADIAVCGPGTIQSEYTAPLCVTTHASRGLLGGTPLLGEHVIRGG